MPFLGNIGGGELLVIGIVLMVIFGNKKMNDMAKNLGQSTKEFKKAKQEWEKTMDSTTSEADLVAKEIKESLTKSFDTEDKTPAKN